MKKKDFSKLYKNYFPKAVPTDTTPKNNFGKKLNQIVENHGSKGSLETSAKPKAPNSRQFKSGKKFFKETENKPKNEIITD